ncbi:FIST N-terminal domain-containing protein [Paracoccus sp. (in: a-proteobacteria)]|uniref:FIST N-terminal domain-containing protein n=1 Tax=Paracoccus sp. TaxID=267 RepID=UPI00289FB688|nr:FIST N-terminal domain-containing protein [Paracoccus sp. (in: a-proteobacteria)]
MTQTASAPAPDQGRALALQAPVATSVELSDPDIAGGLLRVLAPVKPGLVLLFASHAENLAELSRRLAQKLPEGCQIVGCSSAGEIGPMGYCAGTVTALGFPMDSFRSAVCVLRDQEHIPVSEWMQVLRNFRQDFDADQRHSVFGILLADGLARHEDVLVATLEATIPAVPVIGGSAADGLRFGRTCQVVNGVEHPGSALFLLIETPFTAAEVSFSHFSATEKKVVVTAADPQNRTILELNAEPAAEEYARLAGLRLGHLFPSEFARHPLVLRTGRRNHIRAIRSVTPEGGLELMSSIEAGTILRLGRVEDMTQGFAKALEALPRPPVMVLGFDCILRRLAIERAGMKDDMSEIFARFRVAGFNTYGEQYNGMHVNQTFVGMALMRPEVL